jgi:hypothetical protein
MSASHRWEFGGASSSARTHRWEDSGPPEPPDAADAGGGDSDESDFEVVPSTPGEEFVAGCLELYWSRVLNARQFCEMMHNAGRAGITEARRFGLPPGEQSGRYQRKLDSVIPNRDDHYDLPVPGHGKHDLNRQVHSCWVTVPHEEIARDMSEPTFRTLLAERLAGDMPPAYWQHAMVVADAGRTMIAPFALYLDGVPYSNTDSVLGMWIVCLTTGKRYIFAVHRKRLVCQCGCRGWCSFYTFFAFLKWTLVALTSGKMPSSRHDRSEWRSSDVERSLLSGGDIPFRCCCLYIKGDWAEYAHTLGFPTWGDGMRPCYKCNSFGDGLFDTVSHTTDALSWRCNGDNDYEDACLRCEHRVRIVDEATRQGVIRVLRPDKREHGSHGLALVTALPTLGLEANDRLEPSDELPDVCALETATLPCTVVFWRRSDDSLARHRNPLFCPELGLTPNQCLTTDTLHAMYFGPMKSWCTAALWFIVLSGFYGVIGTVAENTAAALLAMRHDLMQWYKASAVEFPNLTRLSDLTPKMVGTRTQRKCKTKAAETWGLMLFLLSVFEQSLPFFGDDGAKYLAAGRH